MTFVPCSRYGKVEFAGMTASSEVIVSQFPDWTTHPRHPGVPVSERFWLIPLQNWLFTPGLQWQPRGK